MIKTKTKKNLLGAAAILALLATTATAAAAQTAEATYELPSQDLGSALRQVAAQSGRNIIIPADLVAGRRAPALRGRYSSEQAVERLLADSPLTLTDVAGNLVIVRTEGRPAAADTASSEVIVVTGTNLRGVTPTSAVTVIRREDIDAMGATSVEGVMARVPQNTQGGPNRETFQVTGASTDRTESGASLNLRGLGERATLVLLNGRRAAPSGGGGYVDISLIPISAVQRIEVLPDGASAIYGSDAVGGVVNILLRQDFTGLESNFQLGSATHGDGDVRVGSLTGGLSWGSGNALIAYERREEDPIFARDRAFTIGLSPTYAIFPTERRDSVFANIVQRLLPNLTAEATGSWSARDSQRTFFFSGDQFETSVVSDTDIYNFSGALRAEFGDWSVRLSGGYSESAGTDIQTLLATNVVDQARDYRSTIGSLGLNVDGRLFDLPAGSVQVAVGAEGRHETYFTFIRTSVSGRRITQARDIGALYGEVRVPLFSDSNRMPGLERLTFVAAGRYESYERTGSTFDPKIGLLWSPIDGVVLRGSYGTSFRAPLLAETAGSYNAILVPSFVVYVNPAEVVPGAALILTGSNPGVQPETSQSYTFGAEFTPRFLPGLTLSADYYNIRFSNRITQPTTSTNVVGNPAFESIVTRNPSADILALLYGGAAQVLDRSSIPGGGTNSVRVIVDGRVNNTAITQTDGLDLALRYAFRSGSSDFTLAGNATLVFSYQDQLRTTAPVIETVDTPFRTLGLRLRGQAGWRNGPISANLFVNHAGGYRDNRGTRNVPVDAWTTVDASIAYEAPSDGPRWARGLRIAVNCDNLFDQDPPRLLPALNVATGIGYDPVNASGRGRFIALQVRKTW